MDDEPEQQTLATDGETQAGIPCHVDSCDNRIVGLNDGWEYSRGTVCQTCIDYEHRHGHWPDDEAEICVQCRIDDGAIDHDCEAFSGDGVLLQPGDTCGYCGFDTSNGGDPITDTPCPRCDSEDIGWSDSHHSSVCADCGIVFRRSPMGVSIAGPGSITGVRDAE